MKSYSVLVFAAVMLCSCGGKVKVSGRFVGADIQNIYLDVISVGDTKVVDSTTTDKKGNFNFSVKLSDGQPTIYNVRYNGAIIPLLLAPGERVKLNSVGNIARNYTVNGSEGSEKMRELKMILEGGAATLDSLSVAYTKGDLDTATRRVLIDQYAKAYYKAKREHIAFIVSNPSSVVAIYALYQRLPNDATLFNGETDIIYFRMVADSVATVYPNSTYLLSLQKQLKAYDSGIGIAEMIGDKSVDTKGYPDIELPDMYGKKQRLSSFEGKVILVDFWSAASANCKMANAELKETYSKFVDAGFEVYQVSVDDSKPLWVTTVQSQKLPWISVCDFRGASSIPVKLYNITSVPANFIIDRNGNIAGKNLYGAALATRVGQLVN